MAFDRIVCSKRGMGASPHRGMLRFPRSLSGKMKGAGFYSFAIATLFKGFYSFFNWGIYERRFTTKGQ
jgi:hypothetical protein